MRLLPKSIHRCRRYPTKFNSGRDIPVWSKYSKAQRFSSLHLFQRLLESAIVVGYVFQFSGRSAMDWNTMLSYISGSVDEELLLRNEYLVAENRVLRNQLQGRLRLTDGERRSLAEIGKRLGKQALDEVASIVNPDTILGWHRRLVAKKFDGSKNRQYPGRPRIDAALLHGPEQIADLPVPVVESPGAVRIGHPERGHLVEYLAPNSVFNSLPRQRSCPHLGPDDRFVTIDRVLHHASLGAA